MKICVLIGDMYRDFALSIIRHLDHYAREKGHRIDVFGTCSIYTSNPLYVNGYKSILSLPPFHQYDGIILCYDTLIHEGMGKDLVDDLLSDMDAPPVVCIRAAIPGFYNIIPDNKGLMYEISKHVISKCSKGDIGFVTGREDLEDSFERRAGFEEAMQEAGIEIPEDKIFHGNYWITQGSEMADFFIKEDGTLPEAIICSNDYEAIALCNELILRGYSIPSDTIISGVDNATEGETHIPSITTIEISKEAFVDSAMKVLEDAVSGKKPELTTYVPGELILRESTADQVVERDAFRSLSIQNVVSSASMDDMREFVAINAIFEGALTDEALTQIALDQLKSVKSIKSCYLCRYRENDRELTGYFPDRGENRIVNISFPDDRFLPDGLDSEEHGMRVYLSLLYKNEVYGYSVFVFDTGIQSFINFKIEFLLAQIGQSINRLELYNKLFGISDVISLYIKDPLTGILNRRGFDKKISAMFDKDGKRIRDIAVVSIDMDGLKDINDTYGHKSGDEAIKQTAACINRVLEPDEFVARMGGDEFVAIIVLSEVGRIGKFIRNVRNNIKDVNKTGNYPYELSSSIGTCELTDWHGVMDCMSKADKAMYLEKKAKKKNR
ncbi:MAG: GGDEF domain-containing protein [Clostridiales bacterium]|nr:GGDEF domain-containing protein [Clostridiales bacterium]